MVTQQQRQEIAKLDKSALQKAEHEALVHAESLTPGTAEYADALEVLDLINEAILPFEGPVEEEGDE